MTEVRDPILQSLFADTQENLDGEAFTNDVMVRTQQLRYLVMTKWVGLILLLILATTLLPFPMIDFALFVTQGLSTELINFGDTIATWLLAPINNVASVLILCLKGIRMAWRKVRYASYAN